MTEQEWLSNEHYGQFPMNLEIMADEMYKMKKRRKKITPEQSIATATDSKSGK